MSTLNFPRGSEWREWDLHIHTPASFKWDDGKQFSLMTEQEKTFAVDNLINSLNKAKPAVFAIMDYWTFDGWINLKKRLKETTSQKLKKTIFPGMELRLVSPTTYRLNAHVIFSDDVSIQDLANFKSKLTVALIDQPLSNECLIRLVREKIGEDKIKLTGSTLEKVNKDDHHALLIGSQIAEITLDSYSKAIKSVHKDKIIGFMPWDTNDGLARADWVKHYSYVIGLMKSSLIFETRKPENWAAFSGIETRENCEWFKSFQAALDNTPRLAVSGSDSHSFSNYGNFPNGKTTWIKADPTFIGLKQAIKEPKQRSFIGDCPKKIIETNENKTYFIDTVKIDKVKKKKLDQEWLSDSHLPLNSDLVAIIGNKGSGKSALADVIALLGNSQQAEHFSFLSDHRFRKKPTQLAKYFCGTIKWCDDSKPISRLLIDDPPSEAPEMVRYIPQSHFEKLCNDHVSGQSNVFENELRSVIFSHTSPAIRQQALDFQQLIDQQESYHRDQLIEYRKELSSLNKTISGIENQLEPTLKKSLQEILTLKQNQIKEHKKIEPPIEKKPNDKLTPQQNLVLEKIKKNSDDLAAITSKIKDSMKLEETIAAKINALAAINNRLGILQRQYNKFVEETSEDATILGINTAKIASLNIDKKILDKISENLPKEQKLNIQTRVELDQQKQSLEKAQKELNAKLNEKQKLYENSIKLHQAWEKKLSELVGKKDSPDSFEGVRTRITQLNQLPKILQKEETKRIDLSRSIYEILSNQRKAREDLFEPVQDLIQKNKFIREEYKLQFHAGLTGSADLFSEQLFEYIKQNTGEFRGEEESYATVRKISEKYDFNNKDDTLNFIIELHQKIKQAANGGNSDLVGIASLLRKNKEAADAYDLLFGLKFLEPQYSLLFQNTKIEQLSPGQRGSLLLIFYLLIDKRKNPIILDQPEENLDNETVVSLLVPVLREAKENRQIIMVTHNPNLAVVCDAEQIIFSSFDRKNNSKISYLSGAIENPTINKHVVNVLEGTLPAFNNRRFKYLKQ